MVAATLTVPEPELRRPLMLSATPLSSTNILISQPMPPGASPPLRRVVLVTESTATLPSLFLFLLDFCNLDICAGWYEGGEFVSQRWVWRRIRRNGVWVR
ncbi:hypothetical protein Hanom_Chr09g00868271 [Helianthus anomalus]